MTATATTGFPFGLIDIDYWVIRRANGDSIKYKYEPPGRPKIAEVVKGTTTALTTVVPVNTSTSTATSYSTKPLSGYCKHDPTKEPVYQTEDGKVGLWIADAAGTRAFWKEFDLTIDCGDVISDYYLGKNILRGNVPQLAEKLAAYTIRRDGGNLLSIDWADRAAPPCHPEFFLELSRLLKGKVLINCQGGHGRSGSTLVMLMMAYAGYNALEAITHLRAVHCPRAIESTVQHKYIDYAASVFGVAKEGSAAVDAEKIKDYRQAFLASTNPAAKPYQDRLLALQKVKDIVNRDDDEELPQYAY